MLWLKLVIMYVFFQAFFSYYAKMVDYSSFSG